MGDMVLKKVLPNLKDHRGKWAPNYERPYVVRQAFSGGALILTNAEGQDLTYLVNADSRKLLKGEILSHGKRKVREGTPEGQTFLYTLMHAKI
ncbi:hypothetical protein CR513_04658, partial [Mucuna pruriens]